MVTKQLRQLVGSDSYGTVKNWNTITTTTTTTFGPVLLNARKN